MAAFDLFVIGGGSGGVACARRAGTHGARVGISEASRVGGTCVNRGCIPKKFLVYASHFSEDFEDASAYGWSVKEPAFDWPAMVRAKDKELERLEGVYKRMLTEAGVKLIEGHTVLADAHTVEVDGQTHTAEAVVVATGAWPVLPEVPGIEHAITSNEAFDLAALPRRIVIVGGAYIAVEFAGIFNGLGADTKLLYRGDMILRGFDDDLRRTMAEEMRKKEVDLRLNTHVARIERRNGSLAALTSEGEVIEADQVMYATGRTPITRGFGLVEAGVELDGKGAVVVDEWSRTSIPNVYAIGDCTNRLNLTPVAIHEGRCLAETLFNNNPQKPDHRNVATAVFGQPPLGTVGLTEGQARATFGEIDVYRARFRPLKHSITGRDETMMMKLVVDPASGRVVGCHIVGADAPEIIQVLGIAVKAGATKAQFDATIGVHPTTAEELVTMREPVAEAAQ